MAGEAKLVLSAEDATRAAFESVKRNLRGLGDMASQQGLRINGAFGAIAGGALLGGIATLVRQVNDGVDKFNDLKDATGASIGNLSALEDVALRTGTSFDTMGTALVKFNAAIKDEDGKNANVFKALGLDLARLKDLDPAAAMRETAVALAQFADDGNKARATQVLFGKSLREVAPFLKDLAEAGELNAKVTEQQALEAEKFNKRIFELQKSLLDLTRMGVGGAVGAIDQLIERFKLGQREGESFLVTVLKLTSPMALIFGASGPKNGYTETREELERIDKLLSKMDTSRKKDVGIQSLVRERERLLAQMDTYLYSGAGAGRGIAGYGQLPRATLDVPQEDKAGDSAAKKAAAAALREAADRAKLIAELNGLSGSFYEDWERLTAIFKSGAMGLKDFTAAQAELLAKQPAIKAQADAQERAAREAQRRTEEADREKLKALQAMQAENEARSAGIRGLEQEIKEMGLSAEALERLRIARLNANIEREKEALLRAGAGANSEAEVRLIQKRIELLQKERDLTVSKSVKRVQVETKQFGDQAREDIYQATSAGLAQALREGRNPIKGFADALGNAVLDKVSRSLADALLDPILGKNGIFSVGISSFFSAMKFADGGIMTSAGAVPLRKYAAGGIASSPQLALYGEGSRPEAYVPLPDGRRIPVAMQGGAGGGDSITIIQNFTVGDVATQTTVQQAVAGSERRMVEAIERRQKYGGGR